MRDPIYLPVSTQKLLPGPPSRTVQVSSGHSLLQGHRQPPKPSRNKSSTSYKTKPVMAQPVLRNPVFQLHSGSVLHAQENLVFSSFMPLHMWCPLPQTPAFSPVPILYPSKQGRSFKAHPKSQLLCGALPGPLRRN